MNKKILLLAFGLMLPFVSSAIEVKTIDRVHDDYKPYAESFMATFTSDADVQKTTAAIKDVKFPDEINVTEMVAHNGDITVPFYIYRPQKNDNKNLNVLFYSHGGGYLFRGALKNYKRYQKLANDLNAAVVVPKYRLSYEAPFPAPILDAYSVLTYVVDNSQSLSLNKDNIILIGDSAGGHMSASLALYNRDHYNFKIKAQVLIYPMLDYKTGSENSNYNAPYTGEICWDRPSNKFAWEKLLNKQVLDDISLGYYSPSYAKDLSNLPDALIYVGDIDLFVNEDLKYASDLIEAGVKTDLHVVSGLFHAFESATDTAEETVIFWNTVYKYIRKHFE